MEGNTRVSTSSEWQYLCAYANDVARYRHSQISFIYKSHHGAGEFYKLGNIKNACGHFCLSIPGFFLYKEGSMWIIQMTVKKQKKYNITVTLSTQKIEMTLECKRQN